MSGVKLLRLSVVAGLAVMTACASPTLTPPPDAPAASYTGVWVGRVEDNVGGAKVEMALTESGGTLTGEVVLKFRVGLSRYSAAGTVIGSADDDTVRFDIVPEDDDYCPYRARATRADDTLEGTYEGVGCQETIHGTLVLQKQKQ